MPIRRIQATTTNKDKNKQLELYTGAWAPVKKVPFSFVDTCCQSNKRQLPFDMKSLSKYPVLFPAAFIAQQFFPVEVL